MEKRGLGTYGVVGIRIHDGEAEAMWLEQKTEITC